MEDFNNNEIDSITSEKEIDTITSEKEINIDNFSRDELSEMLSKMILIRNAEYKIAKGREFGFVGGSCRIWNFLR